MGARLDIAARNVAIRYVQAVSELESKKEKDKFYLILFHLLFETLRATSASVFGSFCRESEQKATQTSLPYFQPRGRRPKKTAVITMPLCLRFRSMNKRANIGNRVCANENT